VNGSFSLAHARQVCFVSHKGCFDGLFGLAAQDVEDGLFTLQLELMLALGLACLLLRCILPISWVSGNRANRAGYINWFKLLSGFDVGLKNPTGFAG
jgi:hypothetical protein